MNELMTIKTADFEADLVIAKSYLEDNGINCTINKEYLTVIIPGRGSARLQVLSEDFERATELLIKGGFSQKEDFNFI